MHLARSSVLRWATQSRRHGAPPKAFLYLEDASKQEEGRKGKIREGDERRGKEKEKERGGQRRKRKRKEKERVDRGYDVSSRRVI